MTPNRIGMDPPWVEDLLGIWAYADAAGGARGHDSACPMFRMWGVVDGDHDDAGDSYSSLELEAMREALADLSSSRPDLYQAVVATFKPWAGVDANDATAALAREAAAVLARAVDSKMEGI